MTITRRVAVALAALASAFGVLFTVAPQASAADGYVYAYQNAFGSGFQCRWLGNDANWADCTDSRGVRHNMQNQATSLYNRGYAGAYADVNFYYNRSYGGAWACLDNGDYWENLALGGHFSWGAGRPGYNQRIQDNIASHKWVNYCGQA